MVEVSERALLAGRQLLDDLARPRLTVGFARLYSQHVRLRSGQSGLPTFRPDEAAQRFGDAVRLVEAGLTARSRGDEDWHFSLRRAGELLEWLGHPTTNPEGLPLSLLGAACYHIAGYPARARSLADRRTDDEQDAPLLRLLMAGRFEELMNTAISVASRDAEDVRPDSVALNGSVIRDVVVREVASALGVIAAEMRWGGGGRSTQALRKLRAAAPAALAFIDPYEWLMIKLAAEVAQGAVSSSLRTRIAPLAVDLPQEGKNVFERYLRLAYETQQTAVWPSQDRGLSRLSEGGSFALCTPTGSGKTRIAEVALLNGLFGVNANEGFAPLCLYIVPTRALAAEVEARLARVLRRSGGAQAITVTGLYGGTDWGPSDDWLLDGNPAVLVCTQEKAEALVRFLGDVFLPRLQTVIVDEAHEVRSQPQQASNPGESRALRLESLVARLRAQLTDVRFIAMSAVAGELERPLAQWISGDTESEAVTSEYRSTRQLVGRLRCLAGGAARIEYDVLDGERLVLQDGDDAVYVPQPFSRHPPAEGFTGPKKGMAPYALWAALQLADARNGGLPQSVLISVVEGISNFVGWCASLLEDVWADDPLPNFFDEPAADTDEHALWTRALAATEDFFGSESRELRLLRKGVVVHHGRMPGRLPRLLIELVERRLVRVVIATSTLTQGVNLPFETILIPGLRRQSGVLSASEFSNLIGRAGRPGVATEGQALVLMLDGVSRWHRDQATTDYATTIRGWIDGRAREVSGGSPLAALIDLIWTRWPDTDPDAFEQWLESTAVGELPVENELREPLDALDGVLVATLDESDDDLETTLQRFWSESFARYAAAEEQRLSQAFIARGRAVEKRFSDKEERRRVYRTSLPPSEALGVHERSSQISAHLMLGSTYWTWEAEERFAFLKRAVELISAVPRFAVKQTVGNSSATWEDVLRWWLDRENASREPTVTQVASWHDFISNEFAYRFNWGLTVAALSESNAEDFGSTDPWALMDFPAVTRWIKELILWGTLDPVAAYLLSRQLAETRPAAEELAEHYALAVGADPIGDPLDPDRIRAWTTESFPTDRQVDTGGEFQPLQVRFLRDINAQFTRWRVYPMVDDELITWFDVAGYPLAESELPRHWPARVATEMDFVLNALEGVVEPRPYL